MTTTPTTAGIDADTMAGEQASAAADAWDFPVMESLTGLDRLRMHVVDPDTFEVCFDYISGAIDEADEMVTRIAELEHLQRHFTNLAKINPAANSALDTARREWAKRAERA